MSFQLYKDTSYKISKRITVSYSTSFSWGIKAFAPEYRDPIFAIYSYVRIADEIVDTFHDFDKKELLRKSQEGFGSDGKHEPKARIVPEAENMQAKSKVQFLMLKNEF